jgi:thiol-disulfide isomerase/thioredoxin
LALLALGIACGARTASALEPGDPAPPFRAPALDGGEDVSLEAHRGKVVYLDFWASWCAPCLQSLPQLEALQNDLGSHGFQVLAVNVDKDPDKARRLLARLGVAYPSASDPAGELPGKYELPTMPTSYVIDGNGVVRLVHEGFRDGDLAELRPKIEALMAVPAKAR